MNRRSLLLRMGGAAVGSVVAGALGCNDFKVNSTLPDLGPAQPPTPVPGMTYIWASKIGCALDCDLSQGVNKYTGGAATDDGPRINAAMSAASPDNPITLIIDGSAMISGLFMPSGGYWSIAGLGYGTGFYVQSGINNDGIHNGPSDANIPFNPGPPAPLRGQNVSLSNFTLNGNELGDSTTGMRQGTAATWYCGINLMNLDNITMENVVVVRTPAFHVRFSNTGNVQVSGCVFESPGLSTDGLHFDGPANDITITKCKFQTGDDSIALNCPEGYTGNISRVSVSECTFNSLSLMRLYTIVGPESPIRCRIDSVSVDNCSGTLSESAFLIGMTDGSLPNSVTALNISNCNLSAPAVLAVAENFGVIQLDNVVFTPSQANVVWVGQDSNHISAFLRPSPLYPGASFIGSSLTLTNCVIARNQNVQAAAVVLEDGSSIVNVEFDGFAVQDSGNYSAISELLYPISSSIGNLIINSLNSNKIISPIQPQEFGNISTVSGSGTGVLSTNWEFPDSVMANEVPYISAATGMPSIKLNGVVEPYGGG